VSHEVVFVPVLVGINVFGNTDVFSLCPPSPQPLYLWERGWGEGGAHISVIKREAGRGFVFHPP